MPTLKERINLSYPVGKVFDVALDIKHYPRILPYIKSVRILEKSEGHITAAIALGLSFINFTYRCEITYKQNEFITVTSKERLFKKFSARCIFEKTGHNETMITYELDARFASPVFEMLAKVIMPYQAKATLRTFKRYLGEA